MTALAAPLFPALTPSARAAVLARQHRGLAAEEMLSEALQGDLRGRIALVSSFGAESVALLHMVAKIDRATPVIFVDTEMLFPETLEYQRQVAARLGLTDLRRVRPDAAAIERTDPRADLSQRDPDACCALRKTRPLTRAQDGFEGWITGRKRRQSSERADLPLFETDDQGRFKMNPLAAWSREDVAAYLDRHDLPRHPLTARGYPSIGCAPCTSPVAAGEDERAGRWRGQDKTECGIHLVGGKWVRG